VNAAQLSRSTLLGKLRDFYALIVKLKREIEEHGADISVERVQGELRAFMDEQLRSMGEAPDEAGYHLYDAMRYVMVALADDAFLHLRTEWPGRARWLTNLLEKQVFGTQRAGAAFFDRIDELLASRDKSKEEVAMAFLFALMLGFKGRFRGEEEHELVSYRERLLYFVGLGQSGGLDPAKPMFPDAYAHTITTDPDQKMPDHRLYVRLLVVVILGYVGLAHLSWHQQTAPIRDVVEQVTQQIEGVGPSDARN
jgi:type VI secretion system protein ImpK